MGAGVRRVVYAQADPNPHASGGAATLSASGVEVVAGVRAAEAAHLNEAWTFSVTRGRPFVTWKVAGTLDGRTAAADAACYAAKHAGRNRVRSGGAGLRLVRDGAAP